MLVYIAQFHLGAQEPLTYDDLSSVMEEEIRTNAYDCIIHSAAVSDYEVSRVLDESMAELDTSAKISSKHSKVYLELTPTKKIIDQVRDWGFHRVIPSYSIRIRW